MWNTDSAYYSVEGGATVEECGLKTAVGGLIHGRGSRGGADMIYCANMLDVQWPSFFIAFFITNCMGGRRRSPGFDIHFSDQGDQTGMCSTPVYMCFGQIVWLLKIGEVRLSR